MPAAQARFEFIVMEETADWLATVMEETADWLAKMSVPTAMPECSNVTHHKLYNLCSPLYYC